MRKFINTIDVVKTAQQVGKQSMMATHRLAITARQVLATMIDRARPKDADKMLLSTMMVAFTTTLADGVSDLTRCCKLDKTAALSIVPF